MVSIKTREPTVFHLVLYDYAKTFGLAWTQEEWVIMNIEKERTLP